MMELLHIDRSSWVYSVVMNLKFSMRSPSFITSLFLVNFRPLRAVALFMRGGVVFFILNILLKVVLVAFPEKQG